MTAILDKDKKEAQDRRDAATLKKNEKRKEDKEEDKATAGERSESKESKSGPKREWKEWRNYGDDDGVREQEMKTDQVARAKARGESMLRNGDTNSPPGTTYKLGYVTEAQRRLNVIEAEEGNLHRCITCWNWSPVYRKDKD